ncbi:hypothetical protein AAMO2058_000561600 [Amorphochlora amoebiformis]
MAALRGPAIRSRRYGAIFTLILAVAACGIVERKPRHRFLKLATASPMSAYSDDSRDIDTRSEAYLSLTDRNLPWKTEQIPFSQATDGILGIQSIDDPRAVERILKANNFEEESVVYNAPLEDFFRGSELNIDPQTIPEDLKDLKAQPKKAISVNKYLEATKAGAKRPALSEFLVDPSTNAKRGPQLPSPPQNPNDHDDLPNNLQVPGLKILDSVIAVDSPPNLKPEPKSKPKSKSKSKPKPEPKPEPEPESKPESKPEPKPEPKPKPEPELKPRKKIPKPAPEAESTAKTQGEEKEAENEKEEGYGPWGAVGMDGRVCRVLEEIGFVKPSEIQNICIPQALSGRDVIGAAETGSGKTLAFGLPVLQSLLSEPKEGLRALIFTPTRELALQVTEHIAQVAKRIPNSPRVSGIVGGIALEKQARILRQKPPIIVATPGRFWELMNSGKLEHTFLRDLSQVSYLVIDEADRMLKHGQFREISAILPAIFPKFIPSSKNLSRGKAKNQGVNDPRMVPKAVINPASGRVQISVFSATLTLPQFMRSRAARDKGGHCGTSNLEDIIDLLPFSRNPFIGDVTPSGRLPTSIQEMHLKADDEFDRDAKLYAFLSGYGLTEGKCSTMGRTIVFVNAISSAQRLSGILRTISPERVHVIHARQQQRQRLKALEKFRNNTEGILIATDVAARGLDIPAVKNVVHYQLPASAETYIHRSGRTARMNENGTVVAVTLRGETTILARLKANESELVSKGMQPGFRTSDGSTGGGFGSGLPRKLKLPDDILMGALKVVKAAIKVDMATHHIQKNNAKQAIAKAEGGEEGGGDNVNQDFFEKELQSIVTKGDEEGVEYLDPLKLRAAEGLLSQLIKRVDRNEKSQGEIQKEERDSVSKLTESLECLLKQDLQEVGAGVRKRPVLNTIAHKFLTSKAKRARKKVGRKAKMILNTKGKKREKVHSDPGLRRRSALRGKPAASNLQANPKRKSKREK